MNVTEIRQSVPLTVTSDGTPVFKVIQIESQSVKPSEYQSTTPTPIDTQSAKQAKLAELRALIAKPKQEKPKAQVEEIPIYNPAIHRPGDKVRVFRNGRYVTMTIPHLDADGNPF